MLALAPLRSPESSRLCWLQSFVIRGESDLQVARVVNRDVEEDGVSQMASTALTTESIVSAMRRRILNHRTRVDVSHSLEL